MSKHPFRAVAVSGFLAIAALVGVAQAKDAQLGSRQRVAAARAHFETVCIPLEANGNFRAAARCFANVSDYLYRPAAVLIGPLAPRPVVTAAPRLGLAGGLYKPYPRRPGSLLASNYVLLGVGF